MIQLAAAPSGDDPRRFAAELLAVIVGDETNSRLYWELVDPGLVESAEIGYYEYEGAGTYMTFLNGSPVCTRPSTLAASRLRNSNKPATKSPRELSCAVNDRWGD